MLRFAGFEFDQQRAELRGPDGEAIRLRPKTFDMLRLFAAHPGRILSKKELIEAIWPNVHVGEDSLSQCVREIRTALGDDKRQMIKVISGRGYLFDVEISGADASPPLSGVARAGHSPAAPVIAAESAFNLRGKAALATVAGIAITAIAIGAFVSQRGEPAPPTIAVMPITDASSDPFAAQMTAEVTRLLNDGLAKIENMRLVMPSTAAKPADFVVNGELLRTGESWTARARMTATATGEVKWTASSSAETAGADVQLQQSRLAAGLGHDLSLRINALRNSDARSAAAAGNSKVAIEQATANINRMTLERFRAAHVMLENALVNEPDNIDLEVALAALQLRGIQMAWYSPQERAVAESNAESTLKRALRTRPNSVPVLEAHCRFLNATNQFVESLVTCAKILSFDPWDGIALYHIGLAQLQLARFEEALTTFKQADRFDTPTVSRWTWLLGAGVTYLVMGREEDAVPWLQQSIAITPASGRPLILLAAAYQRLGRVDEAKAALAAALKLRPGSTTSNMAVPTKNASPVYLEETARINRVLIEAGLPER